MAKKSPDAPPRGLVLDAGAFIALERGNGFVVRLLERATRTRVPLVTSGGVVAQVWRGGARKQVPLAMLLGLTEVVPLDAFEGKLVGMVLAPGLELIRI